MNHVNGIILVLAMIAKCFLLNEFGYVPECTGMNILAYDNCHTLLRITEYDRCHALWGMYVPLNLTNLSAIFSFHFNRSKKILEIMFVKKAT